MFTLYLSDTFSFTCAFLVVLAENGRLKHIDAIAKRFAELTMAHKGELKATVTTVIVSSPILNYKFDFEFGSSSFGLRINFGQAMNFVFDMVFIISFFEE